MTIAHLIDLLRRFPQDATVTTSDGAPLDLDVHVKAHDPKNNVDITAVFGFDDPTTVCHGSTNRRSKKINSRPPLTLRCSRSVGLRLPCGTERND